MTEMQLSYLRMQTQMRNDNFQNALKAHSVCRHVLEGSRTEVVGIHPDRYVINKFGFVTKKLSQHIKSRDAQQWPRYVSLDMIMAS